jgi:hypothetical protein
MKETVEGEELFVRYLLGELPDEDQTRLEEVWFADDGYFEQLLVAEDELKYSYAAGALEAGRRERFEARFGARPGGQASLAFATALISTLSPPATVEPRQATISFRAAPLGLFAACRPWLSAVPNRLARAWRAAPFQQLVRARPSGGWRRSLRLAKTADPEQTSPPPTQENRDRLVQLRRQAKQEWIARPRVTPTWSRLLRFALVSCLIVLVGVLAGIVAQTMKYRDQVRRLNLALSRDQGYRTQIDLEKRRANSLADELEIERSRRLMAEAATARQPKQVVPKDEPPNQRVASFILSPGPLPNSGGAKKPLLQSGDAQRLRLQLHVKTDGEYRSYEALLKTQEGKLVSGQAGLQPARLGPIRVIALTLPARIVPPGDYHLELKGINTGGLAEHANDYYFSVAKRD